MKYLNLFFLFILCMLFTSLSFAQTDFFYYQGSTVPLTISSEKISVIFSNGITRTHINSLLLGEGLSGELKKIHSVALDNFFTVHFDAPVDINIILQQLENLEEVQLVNPVYERNGTEFIAFDRFVVKFDPSVTNEQIEQLNTIHHVDVVRVRGDIYTLKLTIDSDFSVLDMANLYYQSIQSEWAMPDFIVQFEFFEIPDDRYFEWQYYFHNTGQTGGFYDADIDAPEAWDISKGSSDIIVAVIDEGVEPHLDLPTDRITIGYNAINGSSGPNVGAPGGNENHGMACAGIIGATHDITGIAGLAPNCKIMPIRIADDYGTYTSLDNIAMAFDFTWDENINQYGVFADVISNSWGGYHDMSDPIFVNFREAVERAMTQGRNGKGCVVIWAAGNSPGQGISSQAKIEGVLAVGATDKSDNLQYYSPTGPEMDVVAPSGPTSVGLSTGSCPNPQGGVIKYKRRELHGDVWSIDRISARGWNPGFNECPENDWNEYLWTMDGRPDPYPFPEFTAHFGGTSASTPQVAGLAALILSIFPELDESSVRDIIKYSSEDLGPTGWDPSYGYGRINAYYAVAPPASPTNLSSYLDSDPSCVLCHNTQYSIKLDWDENNEPDFSHYIIYRSESSGNCNLCHETLNNPPEDSLSNPQSLNDSVTVEKDCPALSGEVSRFTKSKVEVETGCESGLESTEILTFEPIWAWPENFWIDIQIQGDFTYTYFVTAVDKIVEQESDESNFTIAYVPEGEGFSKPFVRFQGEVVPKIFFLYQNYPNPFNPATTIRFQVPEGMHVTIEIFDVLGQKVKTLVDGFKAAGYYSVAWDGKDDLGQLAPSGIYIYRMTTGDFVEIKTMLLLR